MDVFLLDGKTYNVNVMELKRKFAVTDTKNSGRTMDYSMHRDIIGTFYNYTMKVQRMGNDTVSYDDFYEAITAPINVSHEMTFPYGQETLTFQAYVTQGEDSLQIRKGQNRWEGLSLTFTAMEPQRRR